MQHLVMLLHQNLQANKVTKKCNRVNIEIQRQIYKTLYQNLCQQNLWDSESESKFYRFKESVVRVKRK